MAGLACMLEATAAALTGVDGQLLLLGWLGPKE